MAFKPIRLSAIISRGPYKALTVLVLSSWISTAFSQPPIKVTFLVPDPPGVSPFWTQTIRIMEAVAEDLKIDLHPVYSRSNSYSLKKDGLAALDIQNKPDYFLSGYWISATRHHLQRAEQLGIRTFIFNSGVVPEERREVGQPREKYKLWIGQITPDELQAGYLLADILINKAKMAGNAAAGKVHVIGLGGWGSKDEMEQNRYNGLRKRINDQNDAVLDEFVLTGWAQNTAYDELMDLLKQSSETSVLWAAGDIMALGAIDAVKDTGKIPGQDIFIGGIDWSRDGIDAVASGNMVTTLGSHFLEGAKALILIHDYHHGLDFAKESGVVIQTQLKPITASNAEEYRQKLHNLDWRQIDFKQFSKKYNPALKNYDFTLDELLENREIKADGGE